jgi:hypothetical protein
MNEMDGKDISDDIVVDGEAAALAAIKQLVEDAKGKAAAEEEQSGGPAGAGNSGAAPAPAGGGGQSAASFLTEVGQLAEVGGGSASASRQWQFGAVHLGHPGGPAQHKTEDDLFMSFLLWSQKEDDHEAGRFNASKAFRRLEAFAVWCDKNCDRFFSEPISPSDPDYQEAEASLGPAWCVPQWDLPAGEFKGCACWGYILKDMKMDDLLEALKRPEAEKEAYFKGILRHFFFMMVQSMFDGAVQRKGVVFIQDLGGVSLSQFMSMDAAFKPIETEMQDMVRVGSE